MTFTVGETVVYPNHGAAVIEDIETRQIKGEDRLYLVLRIVGQTDLVVRVPARNLDLVGVRWRRERERGLSAGEKRMLAKARQILVSELALAERVEEDKAEILLDEVLAS